MNNKLKVSDILRKNIPVRLRQQEQQKLANQYLNKITMLQRQLNMEEQKLMELLQNSGTACL